jgi:hypothetical protein
MKLVVPTEGAGDTALTSLLDGLGVIFTRVALEQSLATASGTGGDDPIALILSAEQLAKVHAVARAGSLRIGRLLAGYASVLISPFRGAAEASRALEEWMEGEVVAEMLDARDRQYLVAGNFAAAGPFAGLRFGCANPATDHGLVIRGSPNTVEYVITVGGRGLLTRVVLPSAELFVSSSSSVFDVGAEVVRNLDASHCFSGLVPLIFFLRHCKIASWQTPHPAANVVIDDPTLKPNYGFMNAQRLADCVRELGAAVSIGFIPWNYQRTNPKVVELFLSHWPRLSLCIHGCDHTGAEFSTQTLSASLQRIALAVERMRQLQTRTSLRYDRIIVFPQGKFSAAAMQALRQSELLAAVNTELIDQQTRRGVRAGELLKPAITTYGGFPLFLRRSANEPLANFALDLLLGKPALVVTHHDYFQHGLEPFTSLVRSIRALVPALNWSNLESIVARTFSMRSHLGLTTDVRLITAKTEFSPGGLQGRPLRFSKGEPCPGKSFAVFQDGRQLDCVRQDGSLEFEGVLKAESPTTIEVKLSPLDEVPSTVQPLKYCAKVAARRYLSELRDNYVAKSTWATAAFDTARRVMSGRKGASRAVVD